MDEIKVGPADLNTFWKALVRSIRQPALSALGVAAFLTIMLMLSELSSEGGSQLARALVLGVLIVTLLLTLLATTYQAILRAYLWCRFESDGMLFYWKRLKLPSRRVPYCWITAIVIDKNRKNAGIRYLRKGAGVMGLPSSIMLLLDDQAAARRFCRLLNQRRVDLPVLVQNSIFSPPVPESIE